MAVIDMYLYGASGHAKVVIDILAAQGIKVRGLIDDNPSVESLCGMPVCHSYEGQSPLIITIGNCAIRKKIANSISVVYGRAIHPKAIISPSVSVGEGSVVMPGVVINAETQIGKHCIINTNASIDHECRISDFVHVAPGVTISGDVWIGECSWIGVGAVIKQGIRIGKNCMIGAGSVVVKDIPDGVVAYGNPCTVIRPNN